MNYDEWLNLCASERAAIAENWNVYEREGVGFALTAAGRFAINSPFRIYDARIGTCHGGEYILEFCVPNEMQDISGINLPECFEGFRWKVIPLNKFYGDISPVIGVSLEEYKHQIRDVIMRHRRTSGQ